MGVLMKATLCCIYCIENLVNGKRYIGQTINFHNRKHDHISRLHHNKHQNTYLQCAWNKYGESNFSIYILQECNKDELDNLERYYITKFDTTNRDYGYNRESGGNSRKKVSIDTRWLISKNHADVSGQNNPMFGRNQAEESIQKFTTNQNYISRKHRGTDSHLCSITEDTAIAIKKHFSDGHEIYRGEISDIAKKFGTSTGIVSHIRHGHAWAWLTV